jgi:UDP:flavonoid glycosyltransferase YjiC (YdhE family)
MLGIENNLPMVVAGVHEGKNEINARVGYFKLGINLGTEKPTPAQVKRAVETVLADSTYRDNVKALSKEFSQYEPNSLCAAYVAELMPAVRPAQVSFINRKTLTSAVAQN